MVNSFPAPDAFQDLRFFIDMIRRDKFEDRVTDHLIRGVSKNLLGSLIPTGNDPLEVLADDRVIRRGNYRGQKKLVAFGALQPLPISDVRSKTQHAGYPAHFVSNWSQAQ